MERVYRGYPIESVSHFEAQTVGKRQRFAQAEYDYFRGLYPMSVRNWQRFVEEEMDRNDVPGNMIYDEYPDRETLYLMRERIMRNAGDQRGIEDRDIVLILMLHEMLRRRTGKL